MSDIGPADIETNKASPAHITTVSAYPIQGIDRKGNPGQAFTIAYIIILNELSA